MSQQPIWDLPVRLFHWLLVLSIAAQYITAELMDDAIQWHFYTGYFTLGLIIFRLFWGIFGTRYARFSAFVKSPKAVLAYAKTLNDKRSPVHASHNPLGGYAVILILLLVGLQAVSGLFITDDVFNDGPYRHLVDDNVQEVMNYLHHNVFNLLLIVIALHIAAMVFYKVVKGQSLVSAMLHGKKDTRELGITSSRLLLALFLVIVTASLVYYLLFVAPPAPDPVGFY